MATQRHAKKRRVILDSKYAHWDSALITNARRPIEIKFLQPIHNNMLIDYFSRVKLYFNIRKLYLVSTQLLLVTNDLHRELN
jgi:hypothetical protein